jgi:hypothetical protein
MRAPQNNEQTGPQLEDLLHHLSECPGVFLETPLFVSSASEDGVHSLALIFDLFLLQNVKIPIGLKRKLETSWESPQLSERCWRGWQLLAYLFSHSWFYEKKVLAKGIARGLDHMHKLTDIVEASAFIANPARREELCRLALFWCGLRPQGESPEQAEDRLKALDTLFRKDIEAKSSRNRSRAEEIRRKIQEARAREAANTYARE